jgi:hypothetical protein
VQQEVFEDPFIDAQKTDDLKYIEEMLGEEELWTPKDKKTKD